MNPDMFGYVRYVPCTPARLFGYLNAQERFAALTELCTLRHESQAVEVHICAADDGNKSFVGTD